MTLVDTNVLLDLVTNDRDWVDWSMVHLEATALTGSLLTFKRYRAAGGTRTGVLPDFFIGAHAAVEGCPLLTRDTRRYRTYFPKVTLIAPAT